MKRLQALILTITMMLTMGVGILAPANVLAAPSTPPPLGANDPKSEACTAINAGANCDKPTGITVNSAVTSAVKILSVVIGIAAIFMIIIAGLKYVMANGDASSISSAKSTLIYALIGLVIAVSAFNIVNYVVTNVK